MGSILELFTGKKACHLLVKAEGEVLEKYLQFREFLTHNHDALNLVAELEQLYCGSTPFHMGEVKGKYQGLLNSTRNLVEAVNRLSGNKYSLLMDKCQEIDQGVQGIFHPCPYFPGKDLVLPLSRVTPEMGKVAGGKATNLAVLGNLLRLPSPPGFVITVYAFDRFLAETGLAQTLEDRLAGMNLQDPGDLEARAQEIQTLVREAPVPESLAEHIIAAYEALEAHTRPGVRLAMRSSAVGEDSEASFAGQYVTVLNVGREGLLDAYKEVAASKYAARAILYRLNFGLDDWDTPMCVAGIAMLDAATAGVLYTVDPSAPDSGVLKINGVWGLGEHLVGGEASPDAFYVDKTTLAVTAEQIARKPERLVNRAEGGIGLAPVPEAEQTQPCLNRDQVLALARHGLALERHFGGPQDVEWAVDQEGRLFILQSRPLGLVRTDSDQDLVKRDLSGYPVLLTGGKTASPGIATGRVFLAQGPDLSGLADDAILVARTASPDYARVMGKIKGIITNIGSVASHLASVAREFGVPALFDAGEATASLQEGEEITLVADTATVYQGAISEAEASLRSPRKKHIFNSPMHRRLRGLLDYVSPLNLTDPDSQEFTPAGCRTLHDVIRFAHEYAVKEMFGLGETGAGEGAAAVRLVTHIPLQLHLIDLGDGLRYGLTTCDQVTPDDLTSIPLKALWKGFCHPGISWSGAIGVDAGSFMTLMMQGVAGGGAGKMPGGASYAVLSREYLNLSAKFGYHYATVDSLASDNPGQNYITLNFSGGIGTYYGRFLRLKFLAAVLQALGFGISIKGDLLEASLTGLDITSMERTLDLLGRLLACSRLLDMAIVNEASVPTMIDAFFRGNYDFLNRTQEPRLEGFYTHVGNWDLVVEDGRTVLRQDGGEYRSSLGTGLAKMMGKVMGSRYQDFLDNIEAYFYFPLAIVRESEVQDAVIKVRTKSTAGHIDRAAGLAFGVKNVANYFVWRLNALEDNVILFEYVNNQRFQRARLPLKINTGEWYDLQVEVAGTAIRGFVDGELLLEYQAAKPVSGYVGLWTKADSVSFFKGLSIETQGEVRMVEFPGALP